jgi:integrase
MAKGPKPFKYRDKWRATFTLSNRARRFWKTLAWCDNSYFWTLLGISVQTTLRMSSLLVMRWDQFDLDGRIVTVPSKSGQIAIPLTFRAVTVFRQMPRDDSGYVFPLNANAVDMAWDGVRGKVGVPKLQFRDLRHLAAGDFARRGFNKHQLRSVLGHIGQRLWRMSTSISSIRTCLTSCTGRSTVHY